MPVKRMARFAAAPKWEEGRVGDHPEPSASWESCCSLIPMHEMAHAGVSAMMSFEFYLKASAGPDRFPIPPAMLAGPSGGSRWRVKTAAARTRAGPFAIAGVGVAALMGAAQCAFRSSSTVAVSTAQVALEGMIELLRGL